LPASLLSFHYFDLLGIDRSRLVTGPIQVTQYALLPREGGCQDAAYNAWELHVMREKLLTLSQTIQSSHTPYLRWKTSSTSLSSSFASSGQPFPSVFVSKNSSASSFCNILILYRTMSKFSQNLFDKKRRFPPHILSQLVSLLEDSSSTAQAICSAFSSKNISLRPQLNLRIFSDDNELLMKCIPCQIELFSQSHLVIGVSLSLSVGGAGAILSPSSPPLFSALI
jgi:hypothetical protein